MIFIEPTKTRSIKPIISIRDVTKGKQRCIAFGKIAVEKYFKNKTHVAIEIDYKKKKMFFTPCVAEIFKNRKAFKLINDGGKAKNTKCIYFGASLLKSIDKISSGQYDAFLNDKKISIQF